MSSLPITVNGHRLLSAVMLFRLLRQGGDSRLRSLWPPSGLPELLRLPLDHRSASLRSLPPGSNKCHQYFRLSRGRCARGPFRFSSELLSVSWGRHSESDTGCLSSGSGRLPFDARCLHNAYSTTPDGAVGAARASACGPGEHHSTPGVVTSFTAGSRGVLAVQRCCL